MADDTASTSGGFMQGVRDFFSTGVDRDIANFWSGHRQMEHENAQTDLLRAQTQELMSKSDEEKAITRQKQMETQMQENLARGLAGARGQPTTPGEQSQQLRDLAAIYRDAGMVESAAKLMSDASLIDDRQAARDYHLAETRAKNADLRAKNAEIAARGIDPALIHNQAEWDAAVDDVEARTKEKLFEGGRPAYDSARVERIHRMGETVAQQQADTRANARADQKKINDEVERRLKEARIAAEKSLEDKRKQDVKTKAGKEKDNSAKAPTEIEVKAALGELRTRFQLGFDDPKLEAAAARHVAREVKDVVSANPGIKPIDATQQVIARMYKDGDFPKKKGGKFGYIGGGNKKEDALPLPKSADDAIPGKWYKLSDGSFHMYKGNGMFAGSDEDAEKFKKGLTESRGAPTGKKEERVVTE